jgi:hypothetical protein
VQYRAVFVDDAGLFTYTFQAHLVFTVAIVGGKTLHTFAFIHVAQFAHVAVIIGGAAEIIDAAFIFALEIAHALFVVLLALVGFWLFFFTCGLEVFAVEHGLKVEAAVIVGSALDVVALFGFRRDVEVVLLADAIQTRQSGFTVISSLAVLT